MAEQLKQGGVDYGYCTVYQIGNAQKKKEEEKGKIFLN